MAFFYEANPPNWTYANNYGNSRRFPPAFAKTLEKKNNSEQTIKWQNRQDGKTYEINMQTKKMKCENSSGYSGYRTQRNNFTVRREEYPYPKGGSPDAMLMIFSAFDTGSGRIENTETSPMVQKMFQSLKIDGAGTEGLIFHAIAEAEELMIFDISKLATNFAKIGCSDKNGIAMEIKRISKDVFGTPFRNLSAEIAKCNKKRFNKLMRQLFFICAESKKAIKELPFVEKPDDGEEEVQAADDDSSEEEETRFLELVYDIIYLSKSQKARFPLALPLKKYIQTTLLKGKKYGLTRDEWAVIAEFLFTLDKGTVQKVDADDWNLLIEGFIIQQQKAME